MNTIQKYSSAIINTGGFADDFKPPDFNKLEILIKDEESQKSATFRREKIMSQASTS